MRLRLTCNKKQDTELESMFLAISSFWHCRSVFSSDVAEVYMCRCHVSLGEPSHLRENSRIKPQVQIHSLDRASGIGTEF